MNPELTIEIATNVTLDLKEELKHLLIATVNDGASIGFVSPLSDQKSEHYWNSVCDENTVLLIAKNNGKLCGTIQVQLSTKENGLHRAEIAKLMVLPNMRRRGIARALLREAEIIAKQHKRTLLVLDTREGDASNQLYLSENYIVAGKIPAFALSSNGEYESTVIYYKLIK